MSNLLLWLYVAFGLGLGLGLLMLVLFPFFYVFRCCVLCFLVARFCVCLLGLFRASRGGSAVPSVLDMNLRGSFLLVSWSLALFFVSLLDTVPI